MHCQKFDEVCFRFQYIYARAFHVLQTPHGALQLKVIDLSPSLLKLPDHLGEAEEHLKNHSQVIKNLQVRVPLHNKATSANLIYVGSI